MANITTVIFLLGLTMVSLFIVSVINRQQMRKRLLAQKLDNMKRRAAELEELSVRIEPLVESLRVPQIVVEEAIDLIDTMIKISPTNPYFQVSRESARQRAHELSNPGHPHQIFRLMESDAAIARAQYGLTEAAQIIRKRQANGKLELSEMEACIRELAWANYMIKVVSNVAQGHKATNRNDSLRAHAFYRKALEVATEGSHKDSRQSEIISELGDIMHNKRTALSPHLMPETRYNP